MTQPIDAWHFCTDDRRLGYEDNRLIIAGQSLTVDCELKLCESGLHASVQPIDALTYAQATTITRVQLRGTIISDDSKCVATERYTYWIADADTVLRKFACACALDVADKWDMPDVVHHYLETQDPSARAAAWNAAWAAAQNAAWAAARAAAQAAAQTAAWAAAQNAAWAAARAAAQNAAWATARSAAWAAAWATARDAAWDAAWATARSKYNADLEQQLLSLAPQGIAP